MNFEIRVFKGHKITSFGGLRVLGRLGKFAGDCGYGVADVRSHQ